MKKITVLFTMLLMLAATAASAATFTASFPQVLNGSLTTYNAKENGTYVIFTGFAVNATVGGDMATDSEFMIFDNNRSTVKENLLLINGTSTALNGSWYSANGSLNALEASFINGTGAASGRWNFDAEFGEVTGLTSYACTNSSLNGTTMYFVPAGNYQLMVGYANASLNATGAATAVAGRRAAAIQVDPGRALSMPMIYENGTFNGIASTSDTWDYYSFGVNLLYPVTTIGQVQITDASGDSNARVKYYVANGTDDINKTSSDWIPYNATLMDKGSLNLSTTGYRTLIENATINADQNMITGYVNSGVGSDERAFVVMIKNGSTISTSDVNNRAFKMVYVGSGFGSKDLGNGTAGFQSIVYGDDLSIATGYQEAVVSISQVIATDYVNRVKQNLGDFSTALASTSQFGLTQSNMTTYAADGSTVVGSFVGKQTADKAFSVGIYERVENGAANAYGLAFLIPATAVTSDIAAAGAGYQSNSTLISTATNNFTNNATGYTQTALRAQWPGIASNFSPLTDVKGYAATFPDDQVYKGSAYYTAQFQIYGVGGLIKNLRLYKVSPGSTSSWSLSYASEPKTTTDGAWWISQTTAGGYLNENSVLDPTQEYFVNWVVKDDGSYDTNNTLSGSIVDPVVLGSVPTSSSSSSSGCVFNPAAGFGLEWLLLMLAPLVAVVRSRFKK